jgi:hypothetical protein
MLLTTTSTLQDRHIDDYKGVVSGEAVLGANAFRDMFAGIRDIVGGRSAAATLVEVITDYPGYPDFNPALMQVRVIKHDDTGTGFVADRKTRIGKQVRAYDRYERHQDLVVERSYEGSASARSTWTIHPVDASHSTLTIDASQSMRPVRGLVMRPFLKTLLRHQLHVLHPGGRTARDSSKGLAAPVIVGPARECWCLSLKSRRHDQQRGGPDGREHDRLSEHRRARSQGR